MISAVALAFALYPQHAADVVELAAAPLFVCSRTLAGDVACWSKEPSAARPVPLKGVQRIASNQRQVCALADRSVSCWSELGAEPEPIALPPVRALFEGCADTDDGSWCWGEGKGPERSPVGPLKGSAEGCWLATDGGVFCRGSLRWTAPDAPPGPFALKLPNPAVEVVGASDQGCARLENDEVWCWARASMRRKPMANPAFWPMLPPTKIRGAFAGKRLVLTPAGLCTVDAGGAACPKVDAWQARLEPMQLLDGVRVPIAVKNARQLAGRCVLDDQAQVTCLPGFP